MKVNFALSVFLLPLFFSGNTMLPLEEHTDLPSESFCISQFNPLPKAYAHNDYWHDRPLWDALAFGFSFLEVDVHLVHGQLVVAHLTPFFTKDKRTLDSLYLTPLFQLFQQQQDQLTSPTIRLMIDLKTDGLATYIQLKETLLPFEEMLTTWTNGVKKQGFVEVTISGNRPIKTIAQESFRMVSVDGRISDLGKGYDSSLMPIISDRFWKICRRQLFGWSYSKAEASRVMAYTQRVHQERKMIRFYGIPANTETWQLLLDAKVDWLNTDEIELLHKFLTLERMPSAVGSKQLTVSSPSQDVDI
ncbi:MAG: hypothetical protein AAGJ18_01705 [Bacteroidota bacterium]